MAARMADTWECITPPAAPAGAAARLLGAAGSRLDTAGVWADCGGGVAGLAPPLLPLLLPPVAAADGPACLPLRPLLLLLGVVLR